MDQKDRMLVGLPYKAWLDGLAEEDRKYYYKDRIFDVDDHNGY